MNCKLERWTYAVVPKIRQDGAKNVNNGLDLPLFKIVLVNAAYSEPAQESTKRGVEHDIWGKPKSR